jgi:hypothetical protein
VLIRLTRVVSDLLTKEHRHLFESLGGTVSLELLFQPAVAGEPELALNAALVYGQSFCATQRHIRILERRSA